jgi:hypothetical protein
LRVTRKGTVCVVTLSSIAILGGVMSNAPAKANAPTPVPTKPALAVPTLTPVIKSTPTFIIPTLTPVPSATVRPTNTAVPPTNTPLPTNTPTYIRTTPDGVTKLYNKNGGDMWIAANDAAWDKLIKASAADDELGIQLLIQRGEVLIIPNNTRVTILRRAFTSTQVRILDGVYRGMAGWTLNTYVYNDPLGY